MSLRDSLKCLQKIQESIKLFMKKDKKMTMKVLTISYKIKFVKSARFIATPLSNLHYQGRNS